MALPKRFWPPTPWTIVFTVFALVFSAEMSVLVIQHTHNKVIKSPSGTTSLTAQADSTHTLNITPTATQSTPTQPTPPSAKSSGTATRAPTSSLPDQYGCIPNTSGYDNCVKAAKQNALALSCYSRARTAGDTYFAAEDQAQVAYNTVMAEWNAVKDLPYYTHSPYDEYATDAKTKYNAIEKPAYATYVSTINSLNAQGCNEPLVYSDTSWVGY